MFSNSGVAYIGVFLVILVFLLRVLLKPGRKPALNARYMKRLPGHHSHLVHLEALHTVLDCWLPWERWLIRNPDSEIRQLFDRYRLSNDTSAPEKLLTIARDALKHSHSSHAMLLLWVIYSGKIRGTESSHRDAEYWLDRAAESGDETADYIRACQNLKTSLLRDVNLDPEEIRNRMQAAVEAGLPEAQFAAFCLELTQKRKTATRQTLLDLLYRSACAGFFPAQFMLTRILQEEIPVAESIPGFNESVMAEVEQNLITNHPEAQLAKARKALDRGVRDGDQDLIRTAVKELERLSVSGMNLASEFLFEALRGGTVNVDSGVNEVCIRASYQGSVKHLYSCYHYQERSNSLPDYESAIKQMFQDDYGRNPVDLLLRHSYLALVYGHTNQDDAMNVALEDLLKYGAEHADPDEFWKKSADKLRDGRDVYSELLVLLINRYFTTQQDDGYFKDLLALADKDFIPAGLHLLYEAEHNETVDIITKPWFDGISASCGYAAFQCAMLATETAEKTCGYLQTGLEMKNINSIILFARYLNNETSMVLLDSEALGECEIDRDRVMEGLRDGISRGNKTACDLYTRLALGSSANLAEALNQQRFKVWLDAGETRLWQMFRHQWHDHGKITD